MPNCKKPDFTEMCQDIDPDKLFMTERPTYYNGKKKKKNWKEACKKNISGKDLGIFSKHERSWKIPKNYTSKQWYMMTKKQRGQIMKQKWVQLMDKYNICSADIEYKKSSKNLKKQLKEIEQKKNLPPLPPRLSNADLISAGIKLDDTPPIPPPLPSTSDLPPPPLPPPSFPTELLPPPPPPLRKTKSKKPKKPAKRKTKKLYLNKSAKFSPKTAETWGIPLPQTPNDSPDWSTSPSNIPLELPSGLIDALQRAVGKGTSKKRKHRRKNSTQKAKKKKTQKGKKKKNKKKSKKSKK